MRIGIDCRLWNETGVGRYIRNLVENLQVLDRNNEYVLFLQSKDSQKFKVQNSKFKIVEVNIRWHTLEEQVKFPKILERENLNLVHFPYFAIPISYSRPFVVTIHDLILNHYPTGKSTTLPMPLYALKYFGYQYVLKRAAQKAEKIITVSNATKSEIVDHLGVPEDKVVVTYEGVDDEVLSSKYKVLSKKEKNTKYFLYVGNAYPHKNLEKLIEAFVQFRVESKDDVQLLLVGKDDYFYRRLAGKIEKENIEGVLIKHSVTDEELCSLYSHAIAFVSASKMEGFGLPPLEAMACSTPVLLSDIPSFREICKNIAFYFNPDNISDIKDKMKFVYDLDSKTKQKHISLGLTRVKEFSWKKMAEETLAIYESSLSL